jgi:hypothetical protein
MNTLNTTPRLIARYAASALVLAVATVGAWAQEATTTAIRHGITTYDTAVRNAEIVYVEGNDLVLKLENGKVEHLVVPDSDRFNVGGKEVTVRELTPGTKLTQTITTTTTPRYVNTVKTIKGKVWHVNAPSRVIVAMPDGSNQVFAVPSHAKFTVNGKEKSVFELRKGMQFNATIVTDSSERVQETSKSTVAEIPKPATPQMVGVLLIQQPKPAQEPVATPDTVASAEQLAPILPKTATSLPLTAALGGLALATSLGLGLVRKRFTA